MGLLDKALQGNIPPQTPSQAEGGGFLAKARAALTPREPGPNPVPPELALESPEPPEVEEPRLSVAELAGLESELLGLPPKIDFLLAAFSRLSEALPFKALALFLPCREGLALAASHGFAFQGLSPLPLSTADSIVEPGSPFDDAGRDCISRALGLESSCLPSLRGAKLVSSADSSLLGLWAYAYPDSSPGLAEEAVAIGEILAGCSNRGAPSFSMVEEAKDPVSTLFQVIPPDHCAAAMLFELEHLVGMARRAMPGLQKEAIVSAALTAASGLVGSHGKALLIPGSRIALVLYSSSSLDSELALFQFRKSFGRSLSLLEGSEAPAGQSSSFDPSEGGALEALGRFLAG
jgi:hypothetical protein